VAQFIVVRKLVGTLGAAGDFPSPVPVTAIVGWMTT